MEEGTFRFKRFSVLNSLPAQKVGTDGVLLGAATTLPSFQTCRPDIFTVLDIGTGTGIVALMLAQRLSDILPDGVAGMKIDAIDIDPDAARSAGASFLASPWSGALHSSECSLQELFDRNQGKEVRYSLIVSNPPYYDNSLSCPDPRRDLARHTESLSWREVITFAGEGLADEGRLALILPKQEEQKLLRFASSFGFRPDRLLSISTTARKSPSRLIAEFVRGECCARACRTGTLVIGDTLYHSLTDDFYLE